jgi:hypothetical protein
VKRSEKEAKERLRRLEGPLDKNQVIVTSRRGGGIQRNEGQSVSQGFGSGIKDILAGRRAAKQAKGGK